jgi:hypothetical protein
MGDLEDHILTIPYSQFEQLLDENKIVEVLVGQERPCRGL